MDSFDIHGSYSGADEPWDFINKHHLYIIGALVAVILVLVFWGGYQAFTKEKYTWNNADGVAWHGMPCPSGVLNQQAAIRNVAVQTGLGNTDGFQCRPDQQTLYGGNVLCGKPVTTDAHAWLLAASKEPITEDYQGYKYPENFAAPQHVDIPMAELIRANRGM